MYAYMSVYMSLCIHLYLYILCTSAFVTLYTHYGNMYVNVYV